MKGKMHVTHTNGCFEIVDPLFITCNTKPASLNWKCAETYQLYLIEQIPFYKILDYPFDCKCPEHRCPVQHFEKKHHCQKIQRKVLIKSVMINSDTACLGEEGAEAWKNWHDYCLQRGELIFINCFTCTILTIKYLICL